MTASATIRIFESELEQITEHVMGSPNCETGGELIGLWSHADSPTVLLAGATIVLASGPAAGSRRTPTEFQQDPEVHMALERLAWHDFGFQVVGMWHSHHQLSLHELSDGDVRRTIGYSSRHRRPRYSEILAFILTSDRKGAPRPTVGLRPHVYEDATTGVAATTTLQVLSGESPLRDALRRRRNLAPALADAIGERRGRHGAVPYEVVDHVPRPNPQTARRADGHPDIEDPRQRVATPRPDHPAGAGANDGDHGHGRSLKGFLKPRKHRSDGDHGSDDTPAADAPPGRGGTKPGWEAVLGEAMRTALPASTAGAFTLNSSRYDETGVIELSLLSARPGRQFCLQIARVGEPNMTITAQIYDRAHPGSFDDYEDIDDPATPATLSEMLQAGASEMGYPT